MKVYTTLVNGKLSLMAYTSLKQCCNDTPGVSYNSAIRGKRNWIWNDNVIQICELKVYKIKGRGRIK